MRKAEQQKQVIREYNEQEEIAKMDKWEEEMKAQQKKEEPQQESFNEQGEPQINFLKTQKEIDIPEEIEHPWMDYLIQEGRDDIDRIATKQIIDLNHIIGETAYIREIKELLTEYDEIISKGPHDIGNCTMVEHAIHLITKKLNQCKYRSKTPAENNWIDEQVKIMLKNEVIEEANSSYSSNVVIVKKKDGERKG